MKNILSILIVFLILACNKDPNVKFDYEVTVEDYYTKQPLEGRTVILKYCEGGGLASGRPPCDSVDYDVTNNHGIVEFSGTYKRGWGHGHEFVAIGGEGYPTTVDRRFFNMDEKLIFQLKPLINTETFITSTIKIDSLAIGVSVGGYRSYYFQFKVEDSLRTLLTTIPDQSNSISIRAFRNDTLLKWNRLYFTPKYQGSNKLEHEIK